MALFNCHDCEKSNLLTFLILCFSKQKFYNDHNNNCAVKFLQVITFSQFSWFELREWLELRANNETANPSWLMTEINLHGILKLRFVNILVIFRTDGDFCHQM
jgi:hypothetical protein